MDGMSVGDHCPNCGARRPHNDSLGEIWVKEFRT
jgi:hypothetical protein